MSRKGGIGIVIAWLAIMLCPALGYAWIMISDKGTWPKTWPAALEPLREQARSMDVAHGIQQNEFEIVFKDREQFEKVWPAVLEVKSPGGVLILESLPSRSEAGPSSLTQPGVRILTPAYGARVGEEKTDAGSPQWLDALTSGGAPLPEYALSLKGGKWAAYDGSNRAGFMYRARTDIILAVDGRVVDLNRIPLPPDTPILDRRQLPGRGSPSPKRGDGASTSTAPAK
jgi:hypothetical protein